MQKWKNRACVLGLRSRLLSREKGNGGRSSSVEVGRWARKGERAKKTDTPKAVVKNGREMFYTTGTARSVGAMLARKRKEGAKAVCASLSLSLATVFPTHTQRETHDPVISSELWAEQLGLEKGGIHP